EGRLATIVVRGRDTVTTLAVRLSIKLPYDVFNRPQLERMLQPYRDEGATVTYALVPVRVVEHIGPQVDPLQLLPGSEPQPAPGDYELRIEFTGTARRELLRRSGTRDRGASLQPRVRRRTLAVADRLRRPPATDAARPRRPAAAP